MFADAHGQHGSFVFSGDGLLHGDCIADGAENLVAAGGVAERHAVSCSVAQDFSRGLVDFDDVSLAVGDDDGLKDGLQDGVGELKLHLLAAGFGVAQIAHPDGDAVQLAGDDAEVVAAGPFDTMFEVALGDSFGVAGQHVDGPHDSEAGSHCDNYSS